MKYGLIDVRWNRILIPIYLAIRQKCSLICLVVTVRHRNMAFLQIEKKNRIGKWNQMQLMENKASAHCAKTTKKWHKDC